MTKFSDLKLDPKVMKAIAEAGYETPTPIQAGAIPPALEGRDVLGIAQTGTGKTASFTLPMITLLGRGRARARMPRSLVLCPTRELAAQVAENFDIYAKHTKLTKALLIGGVSFSEQDKLIDRGVDVLIATPGRLLDHFERGKLLLTGVQIMVVDEADRMLDMGFIPDIEKIFQLTPFTRQTLFFSATMASEIERITNTFLHAPERIEVARQATASETITQKLVEITPTRKDRTTKQKRALLRAMIEAEGGKLTNAIIFCNRKTEVDIVAKSLKKHGHDAAPIHGDLDQSHRTRTLEGFRDGKLKLLVASDVAARGLDIPAVSHVFNFDLPSHAEDYVHRIGRTGRAGRKGTSISIATPSDEKYLSAIENLLKKSLPRADAPEGYFADEEKKPSSRGESDSGKGGRRENDRKPAQKDVRKDKPRDSQREDRRSKRGGERGPTVVGMGEHVPQFMLAELRPAVLSATEDNDETSETETPKAPSKRRRSRKSSRDATKSTEVREEQIVEAQPEPAAETPAPEAEAEKAEKPKRSRTRKPRATEKAEASEEEVKPKRTRTRKSSATKPTESEGKSGGETTAAEEAPKPKRTRRKKTDDAATPEEAKPVETKAEEGEAKPKPRRTRRRKSETVESGETTAAQSETESGSGK